MAIAEEEGISKGSSPITKRPKLIDQVKDGVKAEVGALADSMTVSDPDADAGAGAEPKKAGILQNKAVLIGGGILLLGLGFFAIKKFRN
jgi:hypothetical protein